MLDTRILLTELADEVAALVPRYLKDPVENEMSKGNAAFMAIAYDGTMAGRIFGDNVGHGRGCLNIAHRKVSQVYATSYATGKFEELVFAGKLDETQFGINRPDFIGWEGGVPLRFSNGKLLAAAFSGFRGHNDVAIILEAAAKLGLEAYR